MDWSAAWWGITRDFEELLEFGPVGWVIALVLLGLPVGSIIAAARGSLLAVIPLLISIGLGTGWVLYYATDWWTNPGVGGFVVPLLLATTAGWLILLVSVWRRRSRLQHPPHVKS